MANGAFKQFYLLNDHLNGLFFFSQWLLDAFEMLSMKLVRFKSLD